MENGKMKVGVIFGGMSAEAEVSLATGRYIYSLLDPQQFDGSPFYLDKTGQLWQIPDKLVIQNTTVDLEARLEKDGQRVRFEDLPGTVDVIFNALLGKYGEDGCFQGVLELLGIPYTGSGILASALGMDKKVHKRLLVGAGFKVAKDLIIRNSQFLISKEISNLKSQISKELGFPCMVKPTREGSSIGVSVVKKTAELDLALEVAFQYDNEVLVEEYLQGMEYTCVVWGNKEPQAMLPTEVVFEGDFFTYEGKYMPGRTRTITPARVSEAVLKEIQRIAVAVYKLIGCMGYGRVDGFVVRRRKEANQTRRVDENRPDGSTEEGFDKLGREDVDIYVTEPHTGTIMVPSSFVFQQAAKFKIDIQQEFTGKKVSTPMTPRMLVTKIIELALEAHQSKKGLL